MRPSSGVFLVCAAVVFGVSCASKSRLLPDLPCFDAEKLKTEPLVFGAISKDASAPDGWSGMEVLFRVDSAGRLTAALREGASNQTRPVDRVSYNSKIDSLSFTYVAPGHTKFTRTYRPACSRLAGYATYFTSLTDSSGIVVSDTLPRVESR